MLRICDCNVLVNLDNLGWKEVYVHQWTLILIHWKGEQPSAPCVHIYVSHWCLCECYKINVLWQALLKSFVCKHVCVFEYLPLEHELHLAACQTCQLDLAAATSSSVLECTRFGLSLGRKKSGLWISLDLAAP